VSARPDRAARGRGRRGVRRLTRALPDDLGFDARHLRAAWWFACQLRPASAVTELIFELGEGGVSVAVVRKRVEI
jgi:hypothetical protein